MNNYDVYITERAIPRMLKKLSKKKKLLVFGLTITRRTCNNFNYFKCFCRVQNLRFAEKTIFDHFQNPNHVLSDI